jgi:hypothetical protein
MAAWPQHVVACVAGEPDEVGDDLEGQLAGEAVDRLEGAGVHEVGDQRVGLLLDLDLEATQGAGREVLAERGAELGVDRRVGRQRRALQGLVDHRVEADGRGGERRGVGERVADDVVAGQRVEVVGRQVHDAGGLAELGVEGVGVEEDVVGEEVDGGLSGVG